MCRETELSYYQLFPDFKLFAINMLFSVFDSVSAVYASRGAFPVAFAASLYAANIPSFSTITANVANYGSAIGSLCEPPVLYY